MDSDNYIEEILSIEGNEVRVVSYCIGDECYCHVYNVDPGSAIARASSLKRETAKEEAISIAKQQLLKTTSSH